MSSCGLPLETSEHASMALNSRPSPTSTVHGANMSDVPPVSKLELNNRRHSEGDAPLRTGRNTSELAGRGTTIDDLPDELLLEIFSYFSFTENIDVLQEVCPRWKILAQDSHLWLDKKYVVGYKTTEEEAIATFSAVPQLRTVILDKDVSPGVLEALSASCPHLTTLQATYLQVLTYLEADNLFAECKEIRTLTISDNSFDVDVRFFDALARVADLRVLHLGVYLPQKTSFPLNLLADTCPHLCDLKLGSCGNICYQIRDAEYFVSTHRHVLERLSISWMSVKGRCIAPLLSACAETLCRLEVFDCNERTVEEATDMFATLGRVHSLRQLLLHVSDSKVRHLIPAVFENGGLPKLQQLSLSCLIADETTRALVPLCPDLRELELVSCEGHTDALFEQLCRLEKLEKLKINSCKCLGEYAMSHIAKLPALNTLEFRDLKFDKLKPSVDCILEISGLRWLYLFESDCWAIPFDKFPGRLVNLRVLEVDCCEGDQIALDRISAQMPDLTVEGYLWEPFPRQYSQNCFV